MKNKLFWKLILLFVSLPCLMGAQRVSPPEGFSISTMVNQSVLVLTGEVINLEFVFREDVPPQYTTDVTIKVEDMIKGEPNAGEDLVRFYTPGGVGVDPRTGKKGAAKVVGAPKFEKGEKVLMFLQKFEHLDRLPIPYGGLLTRTMGKREIEDDLVSVPYTFKGEQLIDGEWMEMLLTRDILLPIDLTKRIIRATLKEAKAVEPIDERLRAFAKQVPPDRNKPTPDKVLLDALKADVDKILIQE